MKRIFIFVVVWGLWAIPSARSQDAATEERLNKLAGQIEDVIASQKVLRDQIAALSKELQSVRDEQGKPSSYAGHDELNRLAEAIKEVDRKRIEDAEKIHDQLVHLGQIVSSPAPRSSRHSTTAQESSDKPAPKIPDKGFEHVIQSDETLSIIVQGCRDKGIKVTVEQILKANPGLKANKLKVGQKIFIPAAQP
jgi:LysM repeat protein